MICVLEVGHNHIWGEHNSDLSDRYVEITFQFTDIILASILTISLYYSDNLSRTGWYRGHSDEEQEGCLHQRTFGHRLAIVY